jgi:hypothetical protein
LEPEEHMFYISLDGQEYFFRVKNLRILCASWIMSMLEVTKCVNYINHFEMELIWTAISQLVSLLSIVYHDIKNLDLVYLILDFPSSIIHVKANQTGDSCNAVLEALFPVGMFERVFRISGGKKLHFLSHVVIFLKENLNLIHCENARFYE